MSIQYITSTSKKKNKKTGKITVIIIYHSFVPKMKSYGNIGMIPIGNNEKIVDRHIKTIEKKIKNFEIIISSGYESRKLQKYVYSKYGHLTIRCVENTQYCDSNICESLRIAINNTSNDHILIINGNFVFSEKDIEEVITKKLSTLICEKEKNLTLDIKANVNEESKELEHISYGSLAYGWCEILHVNRRQILNEIKKILETGNFQNKIFYELVNTMIKKNIKIKYHQTSESVIKISNFEKKEK